jgi:hypothetical protein
MMSISFCSIRCEDQSSAAIGRGRALTVTAVKLPCELKPLIGFNGMGLGVDQVQASCASRGNQHPVERRREAKVVETDATRSVRKRECRPRWRRRGQKQHSCNETEKSSHVSLRAMIARLPDVSFQLYRASFD